MILSGTRETIWRTQRPVTFRPIPFLPCAPLLRQRGSASWVLLDQLAGRRWRLLAVTRIKIAVLSSAGSNVELLAAQASVFRPEMVAIADESRVDAPGGLVAGLGCRVLSGPAGLAEAAARSSADLDACSEWLGPRGLLPTLAAVDAGIDVALGQ